MVIKKLYSSDSRRRTISKLNSNFVAITPDVILEISDKSPTENMDSIIWIDTSMDTITKEINTKTYADEYFASHLTIDKNTFKYIGTDGEPTLEFKKMLYGDDYDPSFKYILKPKNGVFTKFCIPIKTQNGITGYNLNSIVFDIKDATDLTEAFNSANYLKSIDISSWDTGNVTSMRYMLNGCRSLTSLDLSKWNTSKVTSMGYMFADCGSLTTITGILDLKKCTSYSSMFANCTKLTSVKVKNLPTDIDTFCTRAKIDKSKVIVVQ